MTYGVLGNDVTSFNGEYCNHMAFSRSVYTCGQHQKSLLGEREGLRNTSCPYLCLLSGMLVFIQPLTRRLDWSTLVQDDLGDDPGGCRSKNLRTPLQVLPWEGDSEEGCGEGAL